MSNTKDSVGEATHGDMQYAVTQAVQALGFAYSGVAFDGAKPADMGLVQAGARDWVERKQFQDMKADALASVRSRNTAGSDAGIIALLAQIESSQTPAQLQGAMDAIERVLSSADRLKSEEIDPETREEKLTRLYARYDELSKQIGSNFDKMEEQGVVFDPKAKKQFDALEAQLAQMDKDGVPKDDPARLALMEQRKVLAVQLQAQAQEQKPDLQIVKDNKPVVAEYKAVTENIAATANDKENAPSVDASEAVKPGTAATITLGTTKVTAPANETSFAYTDVKEAQTGTLTVPQGGSVPAPSRGPEGASV